MQQDAAIQAVSIAAERLAVSCPKQKRSGRIVLDDADGTRAKLTSVNEPLARQTPLWVTCMPLVNTPNRLPRSGVVLLDASRADAPVNSCRCKLPP